MLEATPTPNGAEEISHAMFSALGNIANGNTLFTMFPVRFEGKTILVSMVETEEELA